ncbi:MAG: hypothetical protein JOZ57_00975, partial [Abitibacteriaceae bacterium]|nr:hypothetical protein [Abditibacteriaceae bacterium]
MTPKAKFLSLCIVPVLLFIVLARVADMRAKEAENHLVIVNASGQVVKQLSVMFLSFPFNAGPQKIVLSPGHNLFNFTNIPKGSQVDIQYEWLPM